MEAGGLAGANGAPEHLTILVADDDRPFRQSVREALEPEGFVLVAEADDAASAVAAASRLKPDICLIEPQLPGSGVNAIGRIARASPETLIVVLSASEQAQDVIAAVTRGASGYLLKGLGGERLASTLRAAFLGEPALSRSLVPHLVDEIRRGAGRRLSLPEGKVTLTPREWEVGELLRDGQSTTEIANRLGVSPVTVRRHVGLLLRKLGAGSREDAVAKLRHYGRR
jgi:two-component system, NarL family, nitrate/nitrite response regulator NarL